MASSLHRHGLHFPTHGALSLTQFSSSFSVFPSQFNSSMLRKLPLSSSLHRFLRHCSNPSSSIPFLPYSPFSFHFCRPFRPHKVLAMAARSFDGGSQSYKFNNRLAVEHSPYLLQHAHNPVILHLCSSGVCFFFSSFFLHIGECMYRLAHTLINITPNLVVFDCQGNF